MCGWQQFGKKARYRFFRFFNRIRYSTKTKEWLKNEGRLSFFKRKAYLLHHLSGVRFLLDIPEIVAGFYLQQYFVNEVDNVLDIVLVNRFYGSMHVFQWKRDQCRRNAFG